MTAENQTQQIDKMKIAVLASGSGTDFQSIVDAVERGEVDAEIVAMVCNIPEARVIERARKHHIPHYVISHKGKKREDFDAELVDLLRSLGVELVVLAGFMRLLSPVFIDAFPMRIINIHPALLPSFPGAHAHRDALAYGVKVSGCTIHFVDYDTDHGPIIVQKAVEVLPDDTEDTLSRRILEWEHRLLPEAIQMFIEGRLLVEGRHVRILDRAIQG